MIQIKVNNSTSQIITLDSYILKSITNLLSYKNKSYHFLPEWAKKKASPNITLVDKNGKFPTGLLPRAEEWLKIKHIDYTVTDIRIPPKSGSAIPWKKIPPDLRPYQKGCIININKHMRGTVEMATGTGKSICAMIAAKERGLPCLVIVPNKNLLTQLTDTFLTYLDKKFVGKDKLIEIVNFQGIARKDQEYFNRFQHLIIDEAQHSCCNTLLELNQKYWDHIYYRTYWSATPYRSDGSDLSLEGVIGKTIYQYTALEAIRDNWLSVPAFEIHTIENSRLESQVTFLEEYKTHIVFNEERNLKIIELALSTYKQVLILVREIYHGKWLEREMPISKFIQGESTKKSMAENKQVLDDFRDGKLRVLIASGVLGEGADIPNCDILINASGLKAKGDVLQKVGRVLRKTKDKDTALVIDFLDMNGAFVTKHSEERVKHYKTYQSEIKYY